MLLREYLQAKNFECKLCPDCEIGYREFFKEKYDICVLDVMMPKKDGFTLAQEIRQSNAEVPIIFLTAKTLKEDILEGFKLGHAKIWLHRFGATPKKKKGRLQKNYFSFNLPS